MIYYLKANNYECVARATVLAENVIYTQENINYTQENVNYTQGNVNYTKKM